MFGLQYCTRSNCPHASSFRLLANEIYPRADLFRRRPIISFGSFLCRLPFFFEFIILFQLLVSDDGDDDVFLSFGRSVQLMVSCFLV